MNNKINTIKIFIRSILIYLALFTDMKLIYPNIYAQQNPQGLTVNLVCFLQRFDALLGEFSFQKDCCLVLIFILLLLLSRNCALEKAKKEGFLCLCSLLFTVLYLFGHSFLHTNSAAYIVGDCFVLFVSVLRGMGLFFLLRLLLALFYSAAVSWSNMSSQYRFRCKITYTKIFLILVVAWLPQLLIIYPGGYCNDIQDQLKQFFGYLPMADPHPPLFTMIIGCCVRIGCMLSHPNLGLFLYILLQYLFMAAGLAYCLFYFHKKLQNKYYLIFGLLFVSLLPNFSHYASVVIKNAPYAVCLALMTVCALEIMEGQKKSALLYTFAALLGSLICHNGIYIVIPMSVVLVVYVLLHLPGKEKKAFMITGTTLCIVLYYIITALIYPSIGILKEKDHLLYTNQLQHTCRLLLTHPEEFSEDDIAVLNKVIDVSSIPEYYNPVTSDGIKPIVNLLASATDVEAYRKIWNRQIKKHPFLILEASFNVSYGFWSPVARNEENDFSMYFYESEYPEFDFHVPTLLHGPRHIYEGLTELFVSVPIIRLIQNPGLHFWFFVFTASILVSRKDRRYYICLIPGIMTSCFYVGIPAYYHHPRYAFPLIYSAVIYVGILLIVLRQNPDKELCYTTRKEETNEK